MRSRPTTYDSANPQVKDIAIYPPDDALFGNEIVLLQRLRGQWDRSSMLDVGIGQGRTSMVFSAVAGRYLGIDIAPAMIQLARENVRRDDRTRLEVMNVLELNALDEPFDVVLFSYNGIDYLDLTDRLLALRQMCSRLAPDGLLLFTTHSLHALPNVLRVKFPRKTSLSTIYEFLHEFKKDYAGYRIGRKLDYHKLFRQGWARLPARDHPGLQLVHVTVAEQLRELACCNLELVDLIDFNGNSIEITEAVDTFTPPGNPRFLGYLCRSRR